MKENLEKCYGEVVNVNDIEYMRGYNICIGRMIRLNNLQNLLNSSYNNKILQHILQHASCSLFIEIVSRSC